jgi:hypothetical protein
VKKQRNLDWLPTHGALALAPFAASRAVPYAASAGRASRLTGNAPPSSAFLYNFKTVGSQFQNYGFGDMRALFRL